MIVYGDAEREGDAGCVRATLLRTLREIGSCPDGLERHSALVSAFIRAGELVQGVLDAEFAADGLDRLSAAQDTGARLLLSLAQAIDRSWNDGFHVDVDEALGLAARLECSGRIRTRLCEGYAHYGLYPENYLAAARRSGLSKDCRVIGLRSIGLGLAAMVAAALGARPAISVRPVGHPFSREIKADPKLVAADVTDQSVQFAIVDEGPGLSGSSFAAAARWLFGQGVEPGRIHFFPSHDGDPGPQASSEIQAVWKAVRRHPASGFDVVGGPRGVASWAADLVDPLKAPLREITTHVPSVAGRSGLIDTRFARRKFLAITEHGTWLVKFAGLGEIGARKLGDAAALAKAGLSPRVAGLRHGFLVQEWVASVAPGGSSRSEMLAQLGRYISFRATGLGEARAGASLDALRDMALANTEEALGAVALARLGALFRQTSLQHLPSRPVRTDNRLHLWEWLHTERGILKIDAVDHCEAHDLIGCQDIAWDLTGAIVEHELSPGETATLRRLVRAPGGAPGDDALLAFMLPCYLAFQIGLWSSATAANEKDAAAQKKRAACYARRLESFLEAPDAWRSR